MFVWSTMLRKDNSGWNYSGTQRQRATCPVILVSFQKQVESCTWHSFPFYNILFFSFFFFFTCIKLTRLSRLCTLRIVETCIYFFFEWFFFLKQILGKRTPFTYCLKAKQFLQQMFVVFTLGRCSYHSFPEFIHIHFFLYRMHTRKSIIMPSGPLDTLGKDLTWFKW